MLIKQLTFWIGFAVGWMTMLLLCLYSAEPKHTCESVELEQFAFQQCMKMRPTCEGVTTERFITYHENKNWLVTNCPVESGDDSLSQ